MAVEVIIKQKSILKKEITIEDLLLENMDYGIMDENYRLSRGKIGEYTILYNTQSIQRGLEVSIKKKQINLRLPLPTGEGEITFFYEYIDKICEKFKTNTFEREGEIVNIHQNEKWIEIDKETSRKALETMNQDIEQKKYETMYLFGVYNPIAIGKRELEIIQNDIGKLGNFLHQLQSIDRYYASAKVYQKNDGNLFGLYVLTEEVVSIVPLKPSVFMNNDIKVEDWNIAFVYDNDMQGTISFDNFIKNIDTSELYDTEHFIITLSKNEMQKLIEKYKKEI